MKPRLSSLLTLAWFALCFLPMKMKAGDQPSISGKWYFKSIEVIEKESGKKLPEAQSYFGQMMEREVPLEFLNNGKMTALSGGSVQEMNYETKGNQLLLSAVQQITITTDTGTERQDMTGTSVFTFKAGAAQLELFRNDGVLSEKYVLIRK